MRTEHCFQDGRAEGRVLIFSCTNSKTATCCCTSSDRRMLDPDKKDTPHPRTEAKPQQDGRRGKIAFRIKPHTRRRCSEGSNKTVCAPGPGGPRDQAVPASECASVSCGGTGQQWPAAGTGALTTADLGHAARGISPLGGDHHCISPTTEPLSSLEPPRNLTLEASGTRLRNFHRTGETDSRRAQRESSAQDQGKGAVSPQETEPDLPRRVQGWRRWLTV